MRFAFYGRVSTEDQQDPEASRNWQKSRAQALIDRHGEIVTEFFDIGQSRSIPWKRRPEANRLLDALKTPNRGFEAVVIGEPQRAFYGNQYGLTFPVFTHYGVGLWVPEVGGAIDPESEAHDLVMSVFGGMSKGERNRVKIRVRSAMAAITATEGRYLGGRPPYGYRLADAGPHPHPAKAAEGKRLKRLEADPVTSKVVRWIFTQFLGGRGLFDIAEELTREGVPSPSAADPARNKHRCQVAWSKSAVRVIITNPRYTGHQVWNRQRKDEVLLDVEDVGLGHTTKMRWNTRGTWVYSEHPVHEALVPIEDFERAQEVLAARGRGPTTHRPHRTRRPYALRGVLHCGVCDRKMQGNWNNDQAYYRCRFPNEYALANKINHPKVVYLREADILVTIDRWLASAFTPTRIDATIQAMATSAPEVNDAGAAELRKKISTCDHKLRQYRAALDAGADPAEVTTWINTTKHERARAENELVHLPAATAMTKTEIASLLHDLADIVQTIADADATDKADLYKALGLRLTYHPEKRLVEANITHGHAAGQALSSPFTGPGKVTATLYLP